MRVTARDRRHARAARRRSGEQGLTMIELLLSLAPGADWLSRSRIVDGALASRPIGQTGLAARRRQPSRSSPP